MIWRICLSNFAKSPKTKAYYPSSIMLSRSAGKPMAQSCCTVMTSLGFPSIIYNSKVFSTVSVATSAVSVDADPLKNSATLVNFKPCSCPTVKPICSNRFAASLWKSTRNVASVWLTVRLLDISSISFIGIPRRPSVACLTDMMNTSVNSTLRLVMPHHPYALFRHSGDWQHAEDCCPDTGFVDKSRLSVDKCHSLWISPIQVWNLLNSEPPHMGAWSLLPQDVD